MNTQTLDLAFGALEASALSIFEDGAVRKKGNALIDSIDQFIAYVTGEGFDTIVKEARGEPIIKIIPGLTREQSLLKAAEQDPIAIERMYARPAPVVPIVEKTTAMNHEIALLKAATAVLKVDPKLTKEQAITKALMADPALYHVADRAKWGKGPQTE